MSRGCLVHLSRVILPRPHPSVGRIRRSVVAVFAGHGPGHPTAASVSTRCCSRWCLHVAGPFERRVVGGSREGRGARPSVRRVGDAGDVVSPPGPPGVFTAATKVSSSAAAASSCASKSSGSGSNDAAASRAGDESEARERLPPPPGERDDVRFMALALEEAVKAADADEVPVGAVLVHDATGEVLSARHNTVLAEDDPTAHAELKCIRDGAKKLGSWRRLAETTLYVTLEPCPMCAGAVLNARLGAVVWGAPNPLIGADGSWIALMGDGGAGDDGGVGDTGGRVAESAATRGEDDAAPSGSDTSRPLSVSASVTAGGVGGPVRPHAFKPELEVRRWVLAEECAAIMKGFFRRQREVKKAAKTAEKEKEAAVTEKPRGG